jgi:C1A family cysteine protease
MIRAIVVLSVVAHYLSITITEREIKNEFSNFKIRYGKKYKDDTEDNNKYSIFRSNYIKMKGLSADPHANYGVTMFFDMSISDFQSNLLGLMGSYIPPVQERMLFGASLNKSSWDWRNYGIVSQPKNQGVCGACYAFSSIANLEAQYALKYKKSISLSEQHILSCDKADVGCIGGLMENAYSYLIRAGGAVLQSSYPYVGRIARCYSSYYPKAVKVTDYYRIPTTDETVIANQLVTIGPLAAGIHGDLLYYYQSGIMTGYCPSNLNHAVLLVGYGTSAAGVPYWIIKNSWGTTWGENGFFRLKRGTGSCGINKYVITGYIQ